uniref:Uncharacterized protein n=1 Tax=Arundo donax TaxID=35708 RepID=A0A0A9EDC5_ARUDO
MFEMLLSKWAWETQNWGFLIYHICKYKEQICMT